MTRYLAFALAFTTTALFAEQKPAPEFKPTLPWISNLDEALATAKATGKAVLVEFR
ncbi:MAG: hypothetical protein ACI8XO_000720 [Verrucomicrobiales bacterium]|jgi:hypothetical protein